MFRCAKVLLLLVSISLSLGTGFAQKSRIKKLTPTINGSTGLFHIPTAESLRRGEFSFGIKGNQFNREPGDLDITRVPASFTLGLHDQIELFVSFEAHRRVNADAIAVDTVGAGDPLVPATLPDGRTAYFNDAPFINNGGSDGFGDVWAGVKFNLLSERRGDALGVAFQPQARFHTDSGRRALLGGMSSGEHDFGFDFIVSKDAGRALVTATTGLMYANDAPLADRQSRWNLAAGVDIPLDSQEKVHFIGEALGSIFFGDTNTGEANPRSPVDFYGGLRFFPTEWVTVGAAYGFYANTISGSRYGIDETDRHGWLAEAAFHRKINEPPTVSCSVSPDSILPGETARVTLDILDPDDDNLTVTFRSNGGSIQQQGQAAVFSPGDAAPGSYTVVANVSDGDTTSSCSSDITVRKAKKAPVVQCVPGTTTVTEGSSTTLRANASDPNGDALSYTWAVNGQRVPNNSASFEFGTTSRGPGSYTVRVTVTDVDGMTASCEHRVTVTRRPNNNPTCGPLSLSSTLVFAGDTVTASSTISDPDGDTLTRSWTVDGQAIRGTGASVDINTGGFAGGTHTVTVSARDDRNGTCSSSATFSVEEKVTIQMDGTRPDNIAKAQLDEIALKMQQNPQLQAVITGHTDDRGSEAANQRMGLRRAEGLKRYLVRERGVDPSRILTESAGESKPVADNTTAEGRKANRRGEVTLRVP